MMERIARHPLYSVVVKGVEGEPDQILGIGLGFVYGDAEQIARKKKDENPYREVYIVIAVSKING